VSGAGSQTRAFCYVADLVDGLMRLMDYEGEASGPVNLGNPAELTVNEFVARVLAMTGSRSRVVNQPLPIDDPRRRRPDISLARRLLGWSPKVPLEEGLRQTIAWFAGEGATAPPRVNATGKGGNRAAAALALS
jgi:UDP-glucuronate decarboxylase